MQLIVLIGKRTINWTVSLRLTVVCSVLAATMKLVYKYSMPATCDVASVEHHECLYSVHYQPKDRFMAVCKGRVKLTRLTASANQSPSPWIAGVGGHHVEEKKKN